LPGSQAELLEEVRSFNNHESSVEHSHKLYYAMLSSRTYDIYGMEVRS